MTSRRFKLGVVAVAVAALTGIGIMKGSAHAGFGHGRQAIMKRFVTSAIDDVLDEAKVTPQQRATLTASRDRVFSVMENNMRDNRGHMEDALRLFEADRVDEAQLKALRTQREAAHKQVADAVQQALTEAHDTLTPQQRHVVAERIRSFRAGHGE
jgi:Spy/CpxP family protein refolding chaperone